MSGTGNVGGLIGYGYFSHIDNCTVFADVTGTTSVGVLVGGSNFDLDLIINNSTGSSQKAFELTRANALSTIDEVLKSII